MSKTLRYAPLTLTYRYSVRSMVLSFSVHLYRMFGGDLYFMVNIKDDWDKLLPSDTGDLAYIRDFIKASPVLQNRYVREAKGEKRLSTELHIYPAQIDDIAGKCLSPFQGSERGNVSHETFFKWCSEGGHLYPQSGGWGPTVEYRHLLPRDSKISPSEITMDGDLPGVSDFDNQSTGHKGWYPLRHNDADRLTVRIELVSYFAERQKLPLVLTPGHKHTFTYKHVWGTTSSDTSGWSFTRDTGISIGGGSESKNVSLNLSAIYETHHETTSTTQDMQEESISDEYGPFKYDWTAFLYNYGCEYYISLGGSALYTVLVDQGFKPEDFIPLSGIKHYPTNSSPIPIDAESIGNGYYKPRLTNKIPNRESQKLPKVRVVTIPLNG